MIQRFTIATDDGQTAEAAQFTNGFVFIVWDGDEPRPEVWISVDKLQEERPDWLITWTDQPNQSEPDAHSDQHIVDLRANGWTVQHPLACRPYLFDCPVNEAAEHELVDRPAELGRFTCGLDDDGRFEIGDRIDQLGDQEGTT